MHTNDITKLCDDAVTASFPAAFISKQNRWKVSSRTKTGRRYIRFLSPHRLALSSMYRKNTVGSQGHAWQENERQQKLLQFLLRCQRCTPAFGLQYYYEGNIYSNQNSRWTLTIKIYPVIITRFGLHYHVPHCSGCSSDFTPQHQNHAQARDCTATIDQLLGEGVGTTTRQIHTAWNKQDTQPI